MLDPSVHINKIFVEEGCAGLPYTRQILARAGDVPVQTVPGAEIAGFDDPPYPHNLRQGKKSLLLCRNRGRFFKPCPATRQYRCCEYQVLNIGMNCPMDCVYCILQAYLNTPWLSFFVNTDDLLAELAAAFAAEPERIWRIGTGEFTDSLALDRLTGLAAILVDFMKDKKNAVLELKTKSAVVGNLRGLDHRGRTIVAWSLNSPGVMRAEELRTATLDERLTAAARCAEWGYRLAFHFDPVIWHDDWRQGYAATIDALFDRVPAEAIAWISMGCLRYLPHLKDIAGVRFPGSRFFHEEFITGLDGKRRYFRTRRVTMYRHLLDRMAKRLHGRTCVYLCMESDEIWREVFGFAPDERGGLPAMLDAAV